MCILKGEDRSQSDAKYRAHALWARIALESWQLTVDAVVRGVRATDQRDMRSDTGVLAYY